MANLYLCPESDSMYLDVTDGTGSPCRSQQVSAGVWLHIDDQDQVVGVEVFDLGTRGGIQVEDLDAISDGDLMPLLDRLVWAVN
ncbi:MAG: DUF2283 domain-containing protein [Acidimicrobiaceae bacterium]|nr:DUF2283 domain-containing protein [Acidimicrobiaceae bacterium]